MWSMDKYPSMAAKENGPVVDEAVVWSWYE
jgi:hypothetical protein